MKTINFELSKRLNELLLLDDIETENWYFNWDLNWLFKNKFIPDKSHWEVIKTLTLEEALEFLPLIIIFKEKISEQIQIRKNSDNNWTIRYYSFDELILWTKWKTLLEAIEKMITYLLDNNLLYENIRQ